MDLFRRKPAESMSFSGQEDANGFPIIDWMPADIDLLRLGGMPYSLAEVYRCQPAVRICVGFLAQQMGHLKLKTYRRTEEAPEYLRDHPLATLLDRPNDRKTGFDLIHDTVADIAIYDTAYWLKQFSGDPRDPGRKLFLFRIPPAYVYPYGGSIFSGPEEYRVNVGNGNGPANFSPARIVDFSGYSAIDTRYGSSPLEALRSVLNEEVAASAHRENYFKNSARREGVIERPLEAPVLDDEGLKRLQLSWEGRYSGARNAGRTAVLEEGSKWVADSWSPRDSEFIAGREFSIDTVATVYNIPLAVLSRKQTATFASMKEFHKMLYVDTLGPWSARIEATVEHQLVPDFNDDGLFVEFNIEEKLQGDFESAADALRSHVQVPDMSVNQARKLSNESPFGDPEDPENVFNWPARPQNYDYVPGPEEQAPPAANGLAVVPDPAAPDQTAAEVWPRSIGGET